MTDEKMKTCPICKLNDDKIDFEGYGFPNIIFKINCPRCKEFNCPELFLLTSPSNPEPKLSAWIRNRNEQGVIIPEINSRSLDEIQAGLPDYSPREKQIILLQNIELKTAYPGKTVEIIPKYDIPLAWASTEEEFYYYINSLIERGFLKKRGHAGPITRFSDMLFSVVITAAGWDYLEKQERQIEERTQAFVAMSFSDDLKAIWEGPIKNAIKKAGYKPYRVDAEPHSDLIDVKIISGIKNSRFIVSDFTYQNLGVYFETGYAQGMGLPIIRCVREDHFDKVHFDKNHYNFIIWKTPNDLEDQLYNFICAIIGKGKEA